jgi:subtilisin family serine protease
VYSDTGRALWCTFPSDDSEFTPAAGVPPASQGGVWNVSHSIPRTPGIWTTDRSGLPGYNSGGSTEGGDAKGDYTNSFGGTSSSAPGVAGVVALILSLNKALRHEEVRDVLRRACDQIDAASGQYDSATGHSALYGYGRIDALKAVKLAVASPITPPVKSKAAARKARVAGTRRKKAARKKR